MLTDYVNMEQMKNANVNMEHMKNAYRTFNNLSKFLWQQINAWKQGKQAIIYSWWFIYVRCPLVAFLREKKKSWESVFCKMSKQILCTIKIDNIWAPLYYSDSVGRARKFCAHGPIFLQKIPIPVQAQKKPFDQFPKYIRIARNVQPFTSAKWKTPVKNILIAVI